MSVKSVQVHGCLVQAGQWQDLEQLQSQGVAKGRALIGKALTSTSRTLTPPGIFRRGDVDLSSIDFVYNFCRRGVEVESVS